MVFAEYDQPPRDFKQVINDKSDNPFNRQFVDSNNSIQLSWEYIRFYYGYELYWWKNASKQNKIFIESEVLEKTRFRGHVYYLFVDDTPDLLVYYFQIRGRLYGGGYGKKSEVVIALKQYKGKSSF